MTGHEIYVAARCLILACGNTLRGDDGVGPFLAAWAEERWRDDPRVRVLCASSGRRRWSKKLRRRSRCSLSTALTDAKPGQVRTMAVEPAAARTQDRERIIWMRRSCSRSSKELYGAIPRSSLLLTVGAESLELREGFSEAVHECVARRFKNARNDAVRQLLVEVTSLADRDQCMRIRAPSRQGVIPGEFLRQRHLSNLRRTPILPAA